MKLSRRRSKPFSPFHENVLKQTGGIFLSIRSTGGELPMSTLLSFIFESYCLSCLAMFPELKADHSTVEE